MNIESRTLGDVVVFDIVGAYTKETRLIPTLEELIKARLKIGERKIIFNLEKAEINSDVGMGDILASYVSIADAGGQLKLVSGSPKTLGFFRACRIDTILEIYDNVESALESWNKHGPHA
ncbi:MAG: STAS domain-containing protein [Candidatus Aminicenantales bacterium]|jgi:anti-anti-sigma factor